MTDEVKVKGGEGLCVCVPTLLRDNDEMYVERACNNRMYDRQTTSSRTRHAVSTLRFITLPLFTHHTVHHTTNLRSPRSHFTPPYPTTPPPALGTNSNPNRNVPASSLLLLFYDSTPPSWTKILKAILLFRLFALDEQHPPFHCEKERINKGI